MKQRTAAYGLLIALALVLSYLESLVPVVFPVPGMKLGLTNLVVLAALYRMGAKQALIINIFRIILVSMLFGNGFSLMYALAGGTLSTLAMIGLKRTSAFSLPFVSIAGGVIHNCGQILIAILLLGTARILYYLPVLWVSGIAAGAVVGILCGEVLKRLPAEL